MQRINKKRQKKWQQKSLRWLTKKFAEIRFCLFSGKTLVRETRVRRRSISPPENFKSVSQEIGDFFHIGKLHLPIPHKHLLNLVRSILGRRLELQGTRGLISWSGRTMAYTWMSSILSELSQITRESFTLLISSSWKGNELK